MMIDIRTEKKLFSIVLWFLCLSAFLILLTSCSPYAAMPATPTPTQAATATATPEPTPTPRPTCTVNAGSVYLRRGAGMSYAVKQVLHKGDVLTVLFRGKYWLKVETDQNVTGWVAKKYCSAKQSQSIT